MTLETRTKVLHYHFIKGEEWRDENPLLDSEVEHIVIGLRDKKITIKDFEENMEQRVHLAYLDCADNKMSMEAARNYEYVYHKTVEKYWKGE